MALNYESLVAVLERNGTTLTAEERTTRSELARFVYAHAKAVVRDEALAADVAQRVLHKVVRALLTREFVPGTSRQGKRIASLEQWLARCAANGGRDALRAVGRELSRLADEDAGELVSDDAPGDAVVGRNQLRTCLTEFLSALPDMERWLLVQHYAAGLTETELATELGVPVNTAKSRLTRAITRLRALVQRPPRNLFDAVEALKEHAGERPGAGEEQRPEEVP